MNLTNILIISFVASAIIFFTLVMVVYGQVHALSEDTVYICVKDVWSNNTGQIVCKEYNIDDVDGLSEIMHSIYSEFWQELDTFTYGD